MIGIKLKEYRGRCSIIFRFGGRTIKNINTSETASTVVTEDGKCFAWGNNANFEFNSITHCYLEKPVKIRLNISNGKNFSKLLFPTDDVTTMKSNEQNFHRLVKAGSKADNNFSFSPSMKILFREVWSRGGVTFYLTSRVKSCLIRDYISLGAQILSCFLVNIQPLR